MSLRLGLIGALFFALTASAACAQEDASNYPNHTIRIIVGFAAGGGNDVIARIYAQKLSDDLGQGCLYHRRLGRGVVCRVGPQLRADPRVHGCQPADP